MKLDARAQLPVADSLPLLRHSPGPLATCRKLIWGEIIEQRLKGERDTSNGAGKSDIKTQ